MSTETQKSEAQKSENGLLDTELVEALSQTESEDQLITQYGGDEKTPEDRKVNFTSEWFPSEDNWQGKTIIQPHQAQALAGARLLPDIFEELEDIAPIITELINNYEQYLTSVEGIAREQQADILHAIHSGEKRTPEESRKIGDLFIQGSDGGEE